MLIVKVSGLFKQVFAISTFVLCYRCIAIVWPLKRMVWMTPGTAKRKIVPVVFLCAMAYTSYRMIGSKADPGILACNSVSGTALFVSRMCIEHN